jgi:hypothetical protein
MLPSDRAVHAWSTSLTESPEQRLPIAQFKQRRCHRVLCMIHEPSDSACDHMHDKDVGQQYILLFILS